MVVMVMVGAAGFSTSEEVRDIFDVYQIVRARACRKCATMMADAEAERSARF